MHPTKSIIHQIKPIIKAMPNLLLVNSVWFIGGALLVYLSYRQFDRLAQGAILVRVIGVFLIGKGLVNIIFHFVH